MNLAKILAVMAAILLVGAVAVGTLTPASFSLKEGLAAIDGVRLVAAERYIRANMPTWVWDRLVRALFDRPVWLIPAALGIICAGGAATATTVPPPNNTRRRRS